LYGAALYLNPGKLHALLQDDDDDATVGELRGSFLDVLAGMVQDQEIKDKINGHSLDCEALRGPAFSNELATNNLEIGSGTMTYARDWGWHQSRRSSCNIV
jgi:hypothetical protein